MKTKLYAIKTQQGYGLFQELFKRKFTDPFDYIIHKKQVNNLDEKNIEDAISYGYIIANLGGYMSDIEALLEKHKNKEISLMDFKIIVSTQESKKYVYGNCFITYLGEYKNLFNGEYPKYSRATQIDVKANETCWFIRDETLHKPIKVSSAKKFDRLPEEYLNYPLRGCLRPRQLLECFNNGNISYLYFNDEWARQQLEEHYKEYPKTRPSNESIDDISKQIPTEVWKKTFPDGEKKKEYCENCDKVAKILQGFLDCVDNTGKLSSVEVKKLNTKLNKFNEQTQFFDTMEAEDLYLWLVKYFKSKKNPKAVEILEETREW